MPQAAVKAVFAMSIFGHILPIALISYADILIQTGSIRGNRSSESLTAPGKVNPKSPTPFQVRQYPVSHHYP